MNRIEYTEGSYEYDTFNRWIMDHELQVQANGMQVHQFPIQFIDTLDLWIFFYCNRPISIRLADSFSPFQKLKYTDSHE